MSSRRIRTHTALLVGASLCLLAPSASQAGSPATVTVRVEGLTETKVAPTVVTTNTTPIVKDGHPKDSCPGTSAAGALELATAGNWGGMWFGSGVGYSVETIEGESHLFELGAEANYFWSFWLNDVFQTEHGVCGTELQPGDEVLLFVECEGSKCPPNPTPLGVEAPPTANSGEAVTVTVKQYDTKGEASPAVGASVIGGGAGATTDAQGHATLKLFAAGSYTLSVNGAASGPPAVRTETSICVHNGNDGTCGTTAPGTPGVPKGAPETGPPPHSAPPALAVTPGGVKAGHRYRRGRGPRILAGSVRVPAGGRLRDVSISLRRRHGRRCQVLNGSRVAFVRARCGIARFFSVGSAASFSYLLPHALPVGRYVYEIRAVEAGAPMTSPITRTSRVVFYVG